jgi:tetratricopeptide (TPR) repeat protein
MTTQAVFRVFLSSPGDVQPEREGAERVVRRLGGIYSAHVDLRLERWEPRFYEATKSFQQQIESTANFDLVVAILWKRIGTELPPDLFRRPDGSAFESGTVLEIESALESSAKRGQPAVFVFRKTAPVFFSKEHFEQEKRQNDLLDAWWNRTFRDEAGRFRRGSEGFETPQAFETRLEDLLVAQLQQRELIPSGAVWDTDVRGSPFPGLEPYDRDRRSVFFGRDLAVQDALDDLKEAAGRLSGLPALFVIGPSGSGKSSLTRAGIAPSLTDPGTVANVDLWRSITIEADAGALATIAAKIYSGDGLPEIAGGPQQDAAAWARLAAASPPDAAGGIAWALDRIAEVEQRRTGADRALVARLLIVIDQLERIFGTEDAAPFSNLLHSLVGSGRVWLIATLRSDRYAELQRDTNLLELKRRGTVYDLPAPGEAEIIDAVKGPARAAGLAFEAGEHEGRTLTRALIDDTPSADALPLLQMTLRRLFEARDGTTLTWKAYQEMGGVPGAIATHADAMFDAVSPAARRELPDLVGRLVRDVARDASGRIRFVATAAEAGWASIPLRRELAERMVATRLLVRDEPEPQRPVLRAAHEALLRQWRPARAVLERIADRALRRARLLQTAALAAAVIFLGVSVAAGWFWWEANAARDEAVHNYQIALDQATGSTRLLEDSYEAGGMSSRLLNQLVDKASATLGSLGGVTDDITAAQVKLLDILSLANITLGNIPGARDFVDREESLVDGLLAKSPTDAEWQRLWATSRKRSASVLFWQGDIPGGLKESRAAIELVNRLVQTEPDNEALHQDLMESYLSLGDNLRQQGDIDGADKAYVSYLAEAKALTVRDPENLTWQNYLAFAYQRMGDDLEVYGKPEEAAKQYNAEAAIATQLVNADSGNGLHLEALSLSYQRLGDTWLAQQKLVEAKAEYDKFLEISERTFKIDPSNYRWRVLVETAHQRLGELALQRQDKPTALAEFQLYLSMANDALSKDRADNGAIFDAANAHQEVGDALREADKLTDALTQYRVALALSTELTARVSTNPPWQKMVAVANQRIGFILELQGDRAGAAAAFTECAAHPVPKTVWALRIQRPQDVTAACRLELAKLD